MKTYILMKNNTLPITSDDIKVNDIYGIYQNRCKAFWECKVANLKIMNEKDSKNPELLESYVLKEINLETSEILLIFSTRSVSVNPRSLFNPTLILSPSRR